jgi:hypothetical protein
LEYIRLDGEHRLISKATKSDYNNVKVYDLSYISSELIAGSIITASLLSGAASKSIPILFMTAGLALCFQLNSSHIFGKYKKELDEKVDKMMDSSKPFYNAIIKHP